jgi:hypothetical protein
LQDGLVNVIGAYRGTVLVAGDDPPAAFEIKSSGAWTITVMPLASARRWATTSTLSGTGDDVIILTPATSGLTTATIGYTGERNFIVQVYSESGRDGLVNEIGAYQGQVAMPDGTFLLEALSSGDWTIALDA